MLTTFPVRPRRALLVAVLAACALPAGASASVLENDPDVASSLRLRADQETNTVTVRDIGSGSGLEVVDDRGLSECSGLCSQVDTTTARCARPLQVRLLLGDRGDRATMATSVPAIVSGGSGNDTFIGASGPAASEVFYRGDAGADRISYANADRRVVAINNGLADDGRLGLDRDNVHESVEQLGGSRFDDIISDPGTFNSRHELIGGPGNDALFGGNGPGVTEFNMGPFADGADVIVGNGVFSEVDYSRRSRPVNATVDFNGADDGESGEGDELRGVLGFVAGGQAGDTLRARPGSRASIHLDGREGDDTLEGADGDDIIEALAGKDSVLARGGDDTVRARDGVFDAIACGDGIDDVAVLDSIDGAASCETIFRP